jgi:hypothetical protein
MTSDGALIVRYFRRELEVVVPASVEILGKSCFEQCHEVEMVLFENGSTLLRISRSALSHCISLGKISIPGSVEIIEEAAFKDCSGLESCLIEEDPNLRRIEKEAFSECCSLRSLYVPLSVEELGENCFSKSSCLHRLGFVSIELLNKFVNDLALDEALRHFGLYEISGDFKIDLDDGGVDCDCAGSLPAGMEIHAWH